MRKCSGKMFIPFAHFSVSGLFVNIVLVLYRPGHYLFARLCVAYPLACGLIFNIFRLLFEKEIILIIMSKLSVFTSWFVLFGHYIRIPSPLRAMKMFSLQLIPYSMWD